MAGFDWIRLMYFYPQHVTDELVDVIASSAKILPYIDLPLQHINDEMLRRMSRRVTRAETELLLSRLRERIPGLVLRTTFITGFPGETEAQFQELCDFVVAQRFERLGAFTYSLEPDTPAARLPDHVSEAVKKERRNLLMEAQQAVAFTWNRSQIGRLMDVVLDQAVADADNVWVGRSYADAPDVDGLVYVTGNDVRLTAGSIVPCEIVAAQGYDLAAVPTAPPR
jgi:ribosomal protein S12 methylthiotransferase